MADNRIALRGASERGASAADEQQDAAGLAWARNPAVRRLVNLRLGRARADRRRDSSRATSPRTAGRSVEANPGLLALAACLFLVSYGVKAFGWQRLFQARSAAAHADAGGRRRGRRGRRDRAAGPRRRADPDRDRPAGLSGLDRDDRALAVRARADRHRRADAARVGRRRARVDLVAAARRARRRGVLRGRRRGRDRRCCPASPGSSGCSASSVVHWLAEHATCPREAAKAAVFVTTSWSLRAVATFVLLQALGVHSNFALALAFLCAGAASAVLPVAPAGAATQAGAGAAILSPPAFRRARRSRSRSRRRRS